MKVQLLFDGSNATIVIEPESAGEALLLGSIIDPNNIKCEEGKPAHVRVKGTNDRVPYRKVAQLTIEL